MRLILFAMIFGLVGCATTSVASDERPISNGSDIVRSVVLCQSNIKDLQAKLGEPSRDGILGRTRILTWVIDWDPLVKYLGVMADEKGAVVDMYWNLPSEVQWSPTNRCK
jgi:hypothetical protein